MRKVYIASPYTIGDKDENVKRQIDAYYELVKLGYAPFAPLLSHYIELHHHIDYEKWLEIDIEYLLQCNAVLRLEGDSRGAEYEVKIARTYGIPVFYSIEALKGELC